LNLKPSKPLCNGTRRFRCGEKRRVALYTMSQASRNQSPYAAFGVAHAVKFISWSGETARTMTAPVTKVLHVASMPKRIAPMLKATRQSMCDPAAEVDPLTTEEKSLKTLRTLCQSNDGRLRVARQFPPQTAIYDARPHHSAKAVERLCLEACLVTRWRS